MADSRVFRGSVLSRVFFAAAALLALLAVPAAAQSEDEIFGEEISAPSDTVPESGNAPTAAAPAEKGQPFADGLLTQNGIRIGGTYRFKLTSTRLYDGLEGPLGADRVSDSLDTDLGAEVFLDARPDENFRVFGKADVAYPFETGTRITELFGDAMIGDRLFIRAGKQNVNWGVGYFWSPANLLNITAIDPENPDKELEGPVAVKANLPWGLNNLWLYGVVGDAEKPEDFTVAPKLELVAGRAEISTGFRAGGGYVPAAMATITFGWGDFDFFGEGVVSRGSDDASLADPATRKTPTDGIYTSATGGTRYSWSDDDGNFDISIAAQYLYTVSKDHYGGVSVMWNEAFGSDFSLGCFWQSNLSDGSGMAAPSVSWKPHDHIEFAVKPSFSYGEKGSSLAPAGESMKISLSASLCGGDF